MDRIVTLEDIAREMQVSIVTVSNALAGRSGVSEELRTRITEKAREMGYRKKHIRAKKTPSVSKRYQTANRIGVVVPEGLVDCWNGNMWISWQQRFIVLFRCWILIMTESPVMLFYQMGFMEVIR